MERGLSFGSRGPQSDFARLCWRVRIQNNNHQRHATTQGVSHAAVKHPARFRGLRAPHALYCAHQPNSAVKPTPTSSACGCPPCFALRRGLPRALDFYGGNIEEKNQTSSLWWGNSFLEFDANRVLQPPRFGRACTYFWFCYRVRVFCGQKLCRRTLAKYACSLS